MEALIEENAKLKEAMKMMEKNIQRAQHERDLAESNARDIEYQKGTLSEQLKRTSEQLERNFEQLRSVSKQKIGTVDRQICSALPNSLDVAADRYACRARCRAQPVAFSHPSTPRGEGEAKGGGETDGEERLEGPG